METKGLRVVIKGTKGGLGVQEVRDQGTAFST